jgi:hypothetical protein
MSYIGGSQFSVDNRTDNQLFSCIERAEMMEKIKAEIMPMLYTGRVQANSSANYARNYQGQLSNRNGVINRDPSLYQYSGFKDDKINASSRATQSASRFNYAYDRQVNKRYVDVSGQNIANNDLREIPNRSCMMNGAFPLTKPSFNANIQRLSVELMGNPNDYSTSYIPSSANKYLTYKTNRPKLTRQDLMSSAQQYSTTRPQVTASSLLATFPSARAGGFTARTQELLDSARQRRTGLSIEIPSMGASV